MPYDVWRDNGHLIVIEGASIDKEFIAAFVQSLTAEQLVEFLAYDVAKMFQFKEACQRIGFEVWQYEGPKAKAGRGLKLVPHAQGLKMGFAEKQLSMPISVEALEDRLRKGSITIDNNPINTACASNAAPITDAMGNRAFDKARSRGRIDGLITITMAAGAAAMTKPKPRKPSIIQL
jgi:phage terminase large subunit-like protein